MIAEHFDLVLVCQIGADGSRTDLAGALQALGGLLESCEVNGRRDAGRVEAHVFGLDG